MAGLGISFLPLVAVERELRENKLARLDWDDREQQVYTQLSYHLKKWQSPALDAFLEIVHRHAESWQEEAFIHTS